MVWGAIGAFIAAGVALGLALALGRGGAWASVGAGLAAGLSGPVVLILVIRPGKARGVQLWPFLLLGAQAGSCIVAIALSVLLYFSAPQGALDQLALVASAGASFIGSWVGMVRVIGARLRDVTEQAKQAHSQDSSEKTSGQ